MANVSVCSPYLTAISPHISLTLPNPNPQPISHVDIATYLVNIELPYPFKGIIEPTATDIVSPQAAGSHQRPACIPSFTTFESMPQIISLRNPEHFVRSHVEHKRRHFTGYTGSESGQVSKGALGPAQFLVDTAQNKIRKKDISYH